MKAYISTQPKADGCGPGFTLVIAAPFPSNNTIYVVPNYNARAHRHLAWVSRWNGDEHKSSAYFSPALTERVVRHALSGLDFAS